MRKMLMFIMTLTLIAMICNGCAAQQEEPLVLASPTPSPAPTPTIPPTSEPSPSPTATSEHSAEPTPKAISADFIALQEQYGNTDIVGYLTIEGTSIDYPVLQSEDNLFYLDHDVYKNDSLAGSIFMDYENDTSREDKNIVIYGHNMKQDIMFHSLRYYVQEDYYRQHRFISLQTAYDHYTWEVFSFYRTDIQFPYIQVLFPSPAAFYALASDMKSRSIYETGVDILPEDRILTLSTCTNETEDTRFVLNAKLVKTDD